MKVSCIPICFSDLFTTGNMSLSEWIKMAADIGLDGIEIHCSYLGATECSCLEKLTDEISEAGLEVSMFTRHGEFASPSEKEQLEQIKLLRKDIDKAIILGANKVRVTAGSWPQDCNREDALRNVANCLKRSLDYAEEKGVTLALEDHPEIGTSVEDFTKILGLVNDNRLKVNLDTSNVMLSGDSIVELTKIVKDRVVHLHVHDRDEQLGQEIVGQGCVPFPEIFKILKSANFDGWFSLEAGGTKGKQDGKQGIIDGMRYAKNLWKSI